MKRKIAFDHSVFEHVNRRQLLKGALGVAVSAAGVSAISGISAAHFPTVLDIVITPDSEDNRITLSSDDLITVAVLTTTYQTEAGEQAGFDPTEKAVRYRFGATDVLKDGGGARPVGEGQVRDVNGDGKADLVLQFPVKETGFSGDTTVGRLLWERDESGEHGLAGEAPIIVVTETETHEQNTDSTQEDKQKERNKQTDNNMQEAPKQKDESESDDDEKKDNKHNDRTRESEQGDDPC